MRKAQIGQIVVYMLGIVIFSMVLIVGYKAFVNVKQQTDQADFLSFQKGLEADVKAISSDYGSVKKVSYPVRGYKQVCFADLGHGSKSPGDSTPPKIIINSMQSQSKKNVFLVGDKIDSFYVDKINLTSPLSENPICINITKGKLNINLTGSGDSAFVEGD